MISSKGKAQIEISSTIIDQIAIGKRYHLQIAEWHNLREIKDEHIQT